MLYPKSLTDLIECFKQLPGIGEKSAERMAFAVLSFEDDEVSNFANCLTAIKYKIKNCKICGTLTDDELCFVCSNKLRDSNLLMVVVDSKDVFLFEKTGNFNGYYHVLGGLISPLDGIGPDDISIKSLFDRVKKDNIKEVILAIKSGIEADTTSLYIKKVLEKDNVVVSRIASGIPVGADMDYVDALTLESALTNRKEVLDS